MFQTPARPGQLRKLRHHKGKIVMRAPDPTGVKSLWVRLGGVDRLTPYGRGTIARRRAARKVAHESRRRNR